MAKISISDLRPADVALEEAKVVGSLEPLTPTELEMVVGGGCCCCCEPKKAKWWKFWK